MLSIVCPDCYAGWNEKTQGPYCPRCGKKVGK